jgi:putative ABC transport system permease protein
MLWFRTWQLGVKSLMLHPMRSLLTVLGIFIGVASVIWLVAIGEGISNEAQRQIEDLGADTIIVRSLKPPAEATANNRGPTPYGLKRADHERLLRLPTVINALPIREIRRQFRYGERLVDGRLVGCTPEYSDMNRLRVDRGRFLEEPDLNKKLDVCVLSSRVAERLFPFEDPLGKRIYIAEHKDFYQIVGVLRFRTATAAIGGSLDSQDYSNDVYIPISTMRQRIGDTVITRGSGTFEGEILQLNQITLRVNSVENVKATAQLVENTIMAADKSHEKLNDVAVVVPQELLDQAENMRFMFMIFMGVIAAISLVVGGIGIMNIMLATVTERTREIGIRRALGASRADVTRQFLVETIVLSVVGGITGVLAGYACPIVIANVRQLLLDHAAEMMSSLPDVIRNVQPSIVPESVVAAFLISIVVGVVFGLYPAIRAAQMDPIEALRHE